MKIKIYSIFTLLFIGSLSAQSILIDHTCTDITQIPQAAIEQAKSTLHIAYGHTSHGSQLTTGMNGLVDFANNGGKGLALPQDIFEWNNGGSNGALDLDDYAMGGDVGYYPQWVNNTRSYLDDPSHADVNVIIWSWCGQASSRTEETMNSTYLEPMSQLEEDYPNVTFVYMTGHLDGSGETGNLNLRNQQIRDYCQANNKILYDFADIESYDPDRLINYMPLICNDACSYDSDNNGSRDSNWATDWQSSHTQNMDWYSCSSAHSQPLNANQKAYAAWWLWSRLAGWSGPVQDSTPPSVPQNLSAVVVSQTQINLSWNASTDAESGISRYYIYQDNTYIANTTNLSYQVTGLTANTQYSFEVAALNGAGILSNRSNSVNATTDSNPVDNEAPSQPPNLQALAISSTEIDLSWGASIDNVGVYGYRIYRDNNHIGTTSGLTYQDAGLQAATSYSYFVRAYDIVGNLSVASSTVTESTDAAPVDNEAPTQPQNLLATATSTSKISLDWNASTDNVGVVGYRVYRDGNQIATTTNTEYDDSGLQAATQYSYKVQAYDATGNQSQLSASATATTWDPSEEIYTVELTAPDTEVKDAFLMENNPGANYGTTAYVSIIDRFIIQFLLPNDLNNKEIVSADLYLYVWNQTNYQSSQYLDLYRVTSSWSENQVTWNQASISVDWSQAGGDYNSTKITRILHQQDADHTYYPAADIKTLVQKWVDGIYDNYGILVINDSQTDIGLKASEYSSGQPYLRIRYKDKLINPECPDKPTIANLEIVNTNQIRASWNDVTNATGYHVHRSTEAFFSPDGTNRIGSGINDDNGSLAGCQWTDSGNILGDPAQNYFYAVSTLKGNLESADYCRFGEFDFALQTTQTTSYNHIALSLDVNGIQNADDLMNAIPYCNSVAQWNHDLQGYESYIPGIAATNFNVQPGNCYYVNVTQNSTLTFLGTIPTPQYQLMKTQTTNFNEVMLTHDQTHITTADGLLNDIYHCNSVAYWDAAIQGYKQYIPALPMTNFSIRTGYPYFVNVTSNVTWPAELPAKALPTVQIASTSKTQSQAPHLVWGYLVLEPLLTLEDISFEAIITSDPNEILTPENAGCELDESEEQVFWIVQCASFPSGWDEDDTLHIDFKKNDQTILGSTEVILTYNPSDSADTVILSDITGFENSPLKSNRFYLGKNYPNPFNPTTTIPFELPQSAFVQLNVYDIQGKHIKTLIQQNYSEGSHTFTWNAESLPSGLYIYQIQIGDYISRQKMLLLK